MKVLISLLSLIGISVNEAKGTTTTPRNYDDGPNHIIINGYPAKDGKAPYIVGLTINAKPMCGASIIGNEWVITAAHCVDSISKSLEVHYGSNRAWKGEFNHTVDKANIIIYPEWRRKMGSDIALIRTPHVNFSAKVNKIALPPLSDRNKQYENEYAVTCGWGKTSNDTVAQVLQCIDVQVTTVKECKWFYRRQYADSLLCSSDKGNNGRKSVCFGDSGGPLVTSKNPQLVGITALVDANCKRGPSGFTRVAAYVNWIQEKTGIAY